MADGEDSGGGEEQEGLHGAPLPIGYHFTPTNQELVEQYLLPKLQGRPAMPNNAIIEANVYALEPDKLINEMYRDKGDMDVWYFLSPRGLNNAMTLRSTGDGAGRWISKWKQGAGETAFGGKITFCEATFGFYKGPIGTETRTIWRMREFTVVQFENDELGQNGGSKTLDEYVVCKIYKSGRWKTEEQLQLRLVGAALPPPQAAGYHFTPTNQELVEHYLLPRLQGRPAMPNNAIIEANVYEFEPDKLINEMYRDRGETVWYFLSPSPPSRDRVGRLLRTTNDRAGRWKGQVQRPGKPEVGETACGGKITFYEATFAFFEAPSKAKNKTIWLMREFAVELGGKTLGQYVMCKIYKSPRWKSEEESGGHAGKALEEEAYDGGEMRLLYGTAGTGQFDGGHAPMPMCNGQAPMQRPPFGTAGPGQLVANGGGHAPVPMPPRAMCNGWAPMMPQRLPPGASNGQVPMSYHGQMLRQPPPAMNNRPAQPVLQQPSAPFNNQASKQLPPPMYSSQAPPMPRQPMPMRNVHAPVQCPPGPAAAYNGQAPMQQPAAALISRAPSQQQPPMMPSGQQQPAMPQLVSDEGGNGMETDGTEEDWASLAELLE